MRAPRFTLALSALLLLLGGAPLAGCAAGYSEGFPAERALRPARALPDHFLVGRMDGDATSEPAPGACRNPMVDPRDGARLVLVRSAGGRGDYAPPPGRYGVGEAELLRLDCATGRALGIVAR